MILKLKIQIIHFYKKKSFVLSIPINSNNKYRRKLSNLCISHYLYIYLL